MEMSLDGPVTPEKENLLSALHQNPDLECRATDTDDSSAKSVLSVFEDQIVCILIFLI